MWSKEGVDRSWMNSFFIVEKTLSQEAEESGVEKTRIVDLYNFGYEFRREKQK